MRSELAISILSSEQPLDGSSLVVAIALPSGDFAAEGSAIGSRRSRHWRVRMPISISAMFSQLGVLGCVVELDPAQQLGRSMHAQHILEALAEVDVQVVQHQVNAPGCNVGALQQFTDEGNEVRFAAVFSDRDLAVTGLGLDGDEQIFVVPLRTYS